MEAAHAEEMQEHKANSVDTAKIDLLEFAQMQSCKEWRATGEKMEELNETVERLQRQVLDKADSSKVVALADPTKPLRRISRAQRGIPLRPWSYSKSSMAKTATCTEQLRQSTTRQCACARSSQQTFRRLYMHGVMHAACNPTSYQNRGWKRSEAASAP